MSAKYCIDCGKQISPMSTRCKSCAARLFMTERWKGHRIECACEICGKKFTSKKSKAERGWARFCSLECKYQWLHTLHAENACNWRGGKIRLVCDQCGKDFLVYQSRVEYGRRFCAQPCRDKWYSENWIGENHPSAWKGGISNEPYPQDFNDNLREMIRDRDGHKCVICGKQYKRRLLSVHHVDYDKDNSNPNNLVTLCKNCHGKTNENREYWADYFPMLMTATLGLRQIVNNQRPAPKPAVIV